MSARKNPSASIIGTGVLAACAGSAIGGSGGKPIPTPCDEQAEVFFDLSSVTSEPTSFALSLSGVKGDDSLSFISGTSLSAVAAAINTTVGSTGVRAEESENAHRIRLHSTVAGADAFVSVEQIGGDSPRVFALVEGGKPHWMLIAHGQGGLPGDATCDRAVGIADLLTVLGGWGVCAPSAVPCYADVNISGAVDVDDLVLVIHQWGATGN